MQCDKGLPKLGIWLGSFLLFFHRVRSIPPASASSMNDTGRFWSLVPIRQLGVAHFMDDATGFLAEFHSSRQDFVREPHLKFHSSFDSDVDLNFRLFFVNK